jgi:hypothetical protein
VRQRDERAEQGDALHGDRDPDGEPAPERPPPTRSPVSSI